MLQSASDGLITNDKYFRIFPLVFDLDKYSQHPTKEDLHIDEHKRG